MASSGILTLCPTHKPPRRSARQRLIRLLLPPVLATGSGLLIRLLAPRAMHRPLAVPGELLLRISGAGILPLLACRMMTAGGGRRPGRLLVLVLFLQLSAGLTGLLLASLAGRSSSERNAAAEPLDWFRNLVPDNLLQAFVFSNLSPANQTELSRRLGGTRVSGASGNLLGVAAASALLGCALARQRNPALRSLLADAGDSLARLLNSLLSWACPLGALSLALSADVAQVATWSVGVAALGLGLHAVLVAGLVWASHRRELFRLLAALPWPLCVALVAGSSWPALPAVLWALRDLGTGRPALPALLLVRSGSALCNMLALAPHMLPAGSTLEHGALLALANGLFSVGPGDGPLVYFAGLPPLPGVVQRLAALHDLFGSCGCCLLLESDQATDHRSLTFH
ncbi:uncharacterized protein LOC144123880 [Amblyomma americanum]